MNRANILVIVVLLAVAAACSEPRCPSTYVQNGDVCRRCPNGTKAVDGWCIDEAGVVAVDESSDGGSSYRSGEEEREPQQDAGAPIEHDGKTPGRGEGGLPTSGSSEEPSDANVRFTADAAIGIESETMSDAAPAQDAASLQADATTSSGCRSNADCGNATSARCEASKCMACVSDSDCAHIEGEAVCASGMCVQCSKDKRDACAQDKQYVSCSAPGNTCSTFRRDFVCDAKSPSCTQRVAGSAARCSVQPAGTNYSVVPCVSDAECRDGHACVISRFSAGSPACFQLFSAPGSCSAPHSFVEEDVVTVDGLVVDICRPRDATCQSLADYSNRRCGTPDPTNQSVDLMNTADPSKCGAAGVSDGECIFSEGQLTYNCTVRCLSSDLDCPNGTECDRARNVCTFMLAPQI